jgi:hypothetical protein
LTISARARCSTPVLWRQARLWSTTKWIATGPLIAWAKQMNMTDAAALLSETLQEEIKADQLLTQIGATNDNKKAA